MTAHLYAGNDVVIIMIKNDNIKINKIIKNDVIMIYMIYWLEMGILPSRKYCITQVDQPDQACFLLQEFSSYENEHDLGCWLCLK